MIQLTNEAKMIQFIKSHDQDFNRIARESDLDWAAMKYDYINTYGGDMDNLGTDLYQIIDTLGDWPESIDYDQLIKLDWALIAREVTRNDKS